MACSGQGKDLQRKEMCTSVSSDSSPINTSSCKDNIQSVDKDVMSFINSLKRLWSQCKKCDAVYVMLHNYFCSVENPYAHAITLVRMSPDYNQSKSNALSLTVIEQFSYWIKPVEDKYKDFLTDEVKIEAFQVASRQKSRALSKAVVDTYKLIADNIKFLTLLKEMLRYHLYKEVCEWSVLLNLQDNFEITDFLVPLVLQDKLSVIDAFLRVSERHQTELVKFLDDILGQKNMSISIDKIISDLSVPDVQHSTLLKLSHPKALGKFIRRLATSHHLSSDVTPNLSRRTGYSTISYLVRRRYIDENLKKEAFRELIHDTCGDNQELGWQVIERICQAGDSKEALYWCRQFDIPPSEMPFSVKLLHDQGWSEEEEAASSNFADGEVEILDTEEAKGSEFHCLELPHSSIIMVDTEAQLASLLDNGLAGVTMVGIDSEWKPVLNGSRSELALLQIATRETIYLLDVMTLAPHKHLWQELGLILFANQDIIKLGFSLNYDMAMLSNYIGLGNVNLSGPGYLDLASLWSRLVNDFGITFPFEGNPSGGHSLCQLVSLCLGKPLNKAEQFSNWQVRPLRHTQIIYAALDAYCLLEIYEIIKKICSKNSVPFDEIVYEVMVSNWKQGKAKKKSTKISRDLKERVIVNPNPVGVDCVKIVCDTMLAGLGKQLRRCGVDTVNIVPHTPHEDYVNFATKENRIIITKGNIYKKLVMKVPKGMCYRVESHNSEDQLIEVLNYYNVIVKKEDILSRCQLCNGKDLVTVDNKKMAEICNFGNAVETVKYYPEGYLDEGEYSEGFSDDDYNFWDPEPKVQNEPFLITRSGTKIQVQGVTNEVLDRINEFYVCEDCGSSYWDDGHFDRVLGSLGTLAP